MVDLLAIGQGLNALKATTDILKTMVGLRDSAKFLEKTVELNSQIAAAQSALLDAQKEQATLVQTIDTLEKEIARRKAWDGEKERYDFKDVYHGGAFAYVLKPEAANGQPPHWLCQQCYEDGQKRVLQRAESVGHLFAFRCPRCSSVIRAPFEGPLYKP